MLVTFSCDVYANTTYFGDVAQTLLKMMGQSGNVPGAILAEDVPEALQRLHDALESVKETLPDTSEDDNDQDRWQEKPVSLAHRALPLIELLTAASQAQSNVMWDKK